MILCEYFNSCCLGSCAIEFFMREIPPKDEKSSTQEKQNPRKHKSSINQCHLLLPFLYKIPSTCPTARVMPLEGYWWAGRDNAIVTEPTSSHTDCLKTRRLPPVGCTPCY